MGADVVSGGQRHHPAHDRLAGRPFRPQEPADAVNDRLHARVVSVRAAPNLASLVVFRIIQGATGGALQPLSQAVLLESFKPEERGRAMGFWGLGIVVAPILGPVVGGWLTENYSWRWVFYINLPVGIVAMIMTRLFVFDPPYLRQRVAGHRLLGHGHAGRRHRRAAVRPRQGAAGGLVRVDHDRDAGGRSRRWRSIALIVYELTTPHPIVDLRLFKDRSYAVGVFLMTVLGFALYGSLVLLPIMLQTLFGYSSLAAGEAMAPRGIGSLFMMPLVGVLTAYIDPRKLLATGLIVGGATMLWLANINLKAGYWDFVVAAVSCRGSACRCCSCRSPPCRWRPSRRERMGYATSLFNLMRNIGGSIGIAVTGTLLARRRQAFGSLLGEHITIFDPTTSQVLAQIESRVPGQIGRCRRRDEPGVRRLYGMVQRQAAMVSFVTIFRLLGVLFFVMIPLVLLMRKPQGPRKMSAAVE